MQSTGLIRWSPTRLHAFDLCPFRAYQHYVRGLRPPASAAADLGSLTHAVIEHAIPLIQTGAWPRPQPGTLVPELIQHLEATAYQLVSRYPTLGAPEADAVAPLAYRALEAVPWTLPLEVEATRELPLTPQDRLVGRLDVLVHAPDALRVVDWKTGWKPREAAVADQMTVYALLASGDAPHLPVDVTLRWLRTRGGTPHHLFRPAQMPRVRADLLDRIAGIRAQLALVEQGAPPGDAFPPRPASQCATCPVAVLCPAAAPYTTALTPWTAPAHPLAPDAPPAAAQAVGEALLAAEAATTLAKTQLKAWVEQQGQPVRAGDRAWDWYTNQERHVTDTAQRDALLADALAAGADAAVVNSVPSTNVTALLRVARSLKKTHPPLAQALEGLVSTQPGTRLFTHRRVPDPKEATRVQDLA